jgi:RNA polymerase sigma-70 factor (ECF subfamily)
MGVSQQDLIQLLMAQRAMLMGYVSLLVGDPHLVEDVFQEVAVVVLQKGGELDRADAFPAWARTIARFKALHAVRERKKSAPLLDGALLDRVEAEWAGEDARPAVPDSLRDCLRELPPHSRELIELRYQRELSGEEISDRVGKPLNTVYVSLSRIYRALLDCVRRREGVACE